MQKLLDFIDNYHQEFQKIIHYLNAIYPLSINQIEALKKEYSCFPMEEILTQINLQQKALAKVPFANQWLWTDKNLQQASCYELAQYHGELYGDFQTVGDLCCGIGSDLLFISQNKRQCFAVESQQSILSLAKYNMSSFYRDNIIYLNQLSELFNKNCEALYIDPDRRWAGKKMIHVQHLSPNFTQIKSLISKYKNVAVKLSPLINYENSIFSDYDFNFISVRGELKECLMCSGDLKQSKKAVILPQKIIFSEKKHSPTELSEIKQWILEPDPAIIRAHLVNDLAVETGMLRIDPQISLLTSDIEPCTIYGNKYQVIDVFAYNVKKLQHYLLEKKVGILNIKTKGFSEPVEKFRKRITLKGENSLTLFLIMINKKHFCIIVS